jgi:excisionase family DNA binding protein
LENGFFLRRAYKKMKIIYGEKYHTIKEVAEILGMSNTTVLNYIRNGTFKAVKIGGTWHIREAVIKGYIDESNIDTDV